MDSYTMEDNCVFLSSQESNASSSAGGIEEQAEEEVCILPLLPMAVTGFDSGDAIVKNKLFGHPDVTQSEPKSLKLSENYNVAPQYSLQQLLPMSVTGFDSGDDLIKTQPLGSSVQPNLRQLRKLQVQDTVQDDDYVYFPIDDVTVQDLPDWSDPQQRASMQQSRAGQKLAVDCDDAVVRAGRVVSCNEEQLVLLRYADEIFAITTKCPHNGGPLHLGDIEELGDGSLCVRCPWHSWRFDLDTGTCRAPASRADRVLRRFPVRVRDGGRLFVGFSSINQAYFSPDNFSF